MDFGLSEEQRLLQDSLSGFLAEQVPTARVRELSEGNPDGVDTLWKELAELGVAGVLIPERFGGSDLSLLDAALLGEELGRAATPAPFLGSAILAPVAIAAAGSSAQHREWLPRLATGSLRVGAALSERVTRREGAGVRWDGARLRGRSLVAIDAPAADALLVASEDDSLFLVAIDTPGLEVVELTTIDRTRRCAELCFDGVVPGERLTAATDPAAAVGRLLDAGRIVLAADTLGACQSMLDQAVAYARDRHQFGRAIASFQAVKHLCAEMVAELEPARSLVWYAAHAFHAQPAEAALTACLAKSHLAEVAAQIADLSTQVHGGIGYTDEQNLHLWFKRIGLNRQLLGGPEVLREHAARLQGFGDAAAP